MTPDLDAIEARVQAYYNQSLDWNASEAAVVALRENAPDDLLSLCAEVRRLRAALETIAHYDADSKFGAGICPFGCDAPHIARTALGET